MEPLLTLTCFGGMVTMDLAILNWEFQPVAFTNWSAFSFSSASVAYGCVNQFSNILKLYCQSVFATLKPSLMTSCKASIVLCWEIGLSFNI